VFDQLAQAGVDMAQVTQKLQNDGVIAFARSFEELLKQIEAKRQTLQR